MRFGLLAPFFAPLIVPAPSSSLTRVRRGQSYRLRLPEEMSE